MIVLVRHGRQEAYWELLTVLLRTRLRDVHSLLRLQLAKYSTIHHRVL